MNIILDPEVVLVAKSQFLGHPKFELPEDGTDAERLGAFAAKSCYRSYGKDGRSVTANQEHIVNSRHGRILEHATLTLSIAGITRALSLELMTHKHLVCSQESTRYVDMKDAGIVLEPFYAKLYRKWHVVQQDDGIWAVRRMKGLAAEAEKECQLLENHLNACQNAFMSYEEEVRLLTDICPDRAVMEKVSLRKWARGKARNVLPHALETHVVCTGDFRAWRIFLENRTSRFAEAEIRRLANAVFEVIRPLAPTYFKDFENTGVCEGITEWTPTNSKV